MTVEVELPLRKIANILRPRVKMRKLARYVSLILHITSQRGNLTACMIESGLMCTWSRPTCLPLARLDQANEIFQTLARHRHRGESRLSTTY